MNEVTADDLRLREAVRKLKAEQERQATLIKRLPGGENARLREALSKLKADQERQAGLIKRLPRDEKEASS